MMRTSDPYILVDLEKKIFIDKIQQLPENWRNIAGLPGLSDEELSDLKWAGWENLGWINVKTGNLSEYTSSLENLELNKNELKDYITNQRNLKENEFISFDGIKVEPSQELILKLFLLLTSNQEQYQIKIIHKYYCLTKKQISKLYDRLIEHRINFDNWEASIYNQIDSCKHLSEIANINYDF